MNRTQSKKVVSKKTTGRVPDWVSRKVISSETLPSGIIVHRLKPEAPAKSSVKPLNIEMADRTLRVIDRWLKNGWLTKAQAEGKRRETIARVVREQVEVS